MNERRSDNNRREEWSRTRECSAWSRLYESSWIALSAALVLKYMFLILVLITKTGNKVTWALRSSEIAVIFERHAPSRRLSSVQKIAGDSDLSVVCPERWGSATVCQVIVICCLPPLAATCDLTWPDQPHKWPTDLSWHYTSPGNKLFVSFSCSIFELLK